MVILEEHLVGCVAQDAHSQPYGLFYFVKRISTSLMSNLL